MSEKIRRRFISWGAFAVMVSIAAAAVLCMKNPVQKDNGNNGMTLTLEDKTSTTATFSGEPITAFLTFRDSVWFDDIAWHLGAGKFVYPSAALGKKIKEAQVKLLWDVMPIKKDSATGNYFDSIYISKGGELYRSNSAIVFVTNLAPVIDSIKISNRTYSARDTVRDTVRAYDTLPTLAIRVFAHDLNLNTLKCSWLDPSSRVSSAANSLSASYLVPHSNYTDTVRLSVYDGMGGSVDRILFITSTGFRNRPPIIDSIRVKDSVFRGASSPVFYAAARLDSLSFRVWARDSDVVDNIVIQWTDKNVKQVALRPQGATMTMTWACTSATCKDTVKAGVKIMDTVIVTARDNDSAWTSRTIIIVKGNLGSNKPPVIDSLRINDTLAKGAWTLLRYQATCRDSIRLRMFGHDPDSADTIHWTLRALDSTRLKNVSDTAALYVCKDTLYRDTLTLMLSDNHLGSAVRQVVIDVNNRYPVLDSIRCGDSLFASSSALYASAAAAMDSLPITLFAHDPDSLDALKDTLYSSGKVVPVRLAGPLQYRYVCRDSTYIDTLTASVKDKMAKTATKKIKLSVTKK